MSRDRCGTCGGDLVLEQIGLRGEARTYVVTMHDFPLLRCARGHETREAYDEFMVNLGEELAFRGHLFSRRVGFLRRRDVCRTCGTELNLNAVASQRMEVSLEHGGAPPYRLEITAPLVRCSKCATPQIPDRGEHHVGLDTAMRNALATAEVEYQG